MKTLFRIVLLPVLLLGLGVLTAAAAADTTDSQPLPWLEQDFAATVAETNTALLAFDWDLLTWWEPEPGNDASSLEHNLPETIMLQSLNICWGDTGPGVYDVAVATDGSEWQQVASSSRAAGETDLLTLAVPVAMCRIRLTVYPDTATGGGVVREIELNPDAAEAETSGHAAPHRNRSVAAARSAAAGTGPKTLVVDDYAAIRRIVRNMLRQMNYSDVSEAGNCEDALAMLRNGEFDLVICDWTLQGTTGLELLKPLRADSRLKELPVLMMFNAAGNQGMIAEAMAAGMSAYICKPFNVTTLQHMIRICWTTDPDGLQH